MDPSSPALPSPQGQGQTLSTTPALPSLFMLSPNKGQRNLTANEDGFKAFEAKPLRGGLRQARVVVPIGRVLHPPPRGAAGFEALYSCLSKVTYDKYFFSTTFSSPIALK